MELTSLSFILLLLSAYSMVRGQEETSTNQTGCRRGPGRDTPSTSNIVSSISMEEFRSYYPVPGNIDIELTDGPAVTTIGEGDGAIYLPGNS